MATRVQRPLKVVAFNANGIGTQRYELSTQLQEQRIGVALLPDTRQKPHESSILQITKFIGPTASRV
jgi:hypothetical protein